jgi:hypothetical protein
MAVVAASEGFEVLEMVVVVSLLFDKVDDIAVADNADASAVVISDVLSTVSSFVAFSSLPFAIASVFEAKFGFLIPPSLVILGPGSFCTVANILTRFHV